jgi:hypothetical protein
MATPNAPERSPELLRAILEDRYAGLMVDRRDGNAPSRLRSRLDHVLQEVIAGLTRQSWEGGLAGEQPDGVPFDEVDALIRETLVRRVADLGLVR